MQTFLPLSITETPPVLDPSRRNKQILEGRQIVNCLWKKERGTAKGWANHPAVTMWEGYTWALLFYLRCVHEEYKEKTGKWHQAYMNMLDEHGAWGGAHRPHQFPAWIGHEPLHSSHRRRLLHKGTLDVLRKRLPDKQWPKRHFNKELRDFTVQDVHNAADMLTLNYQTDLLDPSHYVQFGWAESPSDDYIWPRDLTLPVS